MRFNRFSSLGLFFCVVCFRFCFAATVYIVPFRGFDRSDEQTTKFDSGLFGKLKKSLNILGYPCKFISFDYVSNIYDNNLKYLILLNFSHTQSKSTTLSYREYVAEVLKRFEKKKLALMCFEPEPVEPANHDPEIHKLFGNVITSYDNFKGSKYHKFYYPVIVYDLSMPQIPFQQRKLATLINGCKTSKHPNEIYSQRLGVINFFEQLKTKDFDFYGVGWGKKNYKNYGGNVPDKIEILKKYKFCYCFENTKNVTGYITEKILDCFSAGCVPIYWGATNIDWYIPKNCYILREDFGSWQEIYNFIKNMPEYQYQEYINNIKKYLSSDAVLLFSSENFIDTVLKSLFPEYNRTKVFNEKELVNLKKVDNWISEHLSKKYI